MTSNWLSNVTWRGFHGRSLPSIALTQCWLVADPLRYDTWLDPSLAVLCAHIYTQRTRRPAHPPTHPLTHALTPSASGSTAVAAGAQAANHLAQGCHVAAWDAFEPLHPAPLATASEAGSGAAQAHFATLSPHHECCCCLSQAGPHVACCFTVRRTNEAATIASAKFRATSLCLPCMGFFPRPPARASCRRVGQSRSPEACALQT